MQDNASIHTCKLVKAQLESWQQQGLFFFQLPAYCSEMNLIEGNRP
ncbi:MAG: transposase [Cyanobacteria bacterium J06635_11]